MGQVKGNPTPSYQNQAYESLRPNDRTNRNLGNTPVMVGYGETLNNVIDSTFATDSDLIANAAADALKATIVSQTALSASIATTYATSASLVNTLASFVVYGGPGGGHANDAAAALNGCPIGGLYHTAGTVKVRLT